MPDNTTIAAAMAHIDNTEDERDELIAALDAIRNDVIALANENDQLREQLADADRRTSKAVREAVGYGFKLGAAAAKAEAEGVNP